MADNRYGDEGGWRGERGRVRSNSIFGDNDRERSGQGSGEEDRGFLERAGEGIRSFFSGEEGDRSGGRYSGPSHYGSQHGYGGVQGDYSGGAGQGGFGGKGDYAGGGGRQSFSSGRFGSGEHDHYLSWRERQIAELDRDYEEYCRERQQQFQSDFASWRQSRQGAGTSASTGSGGSPDLTVGSGGTTAGGATSSRTGALLGGGAQEGASGMTGEGETQSAGGSRSKGRS